MTETTPSSAPSPPTSDTETNTAQETDNSEFDVPPDAEPLECSYCGNPFADNGALTLHRGLAHENQLTDDEQDAFENAFESEADDLRLFRLKALGVLIVLYFGLLMAYSIFT